MWLFIIGLFHIFWCINIHGHLELNDAHEKVTNILLDNTYLKNVNFIFDRKILFQLPNNSVPRIQVGTDFYTSVVAGTNTYFTRVTPGPAAISIGWYANFNAKVTYIGSNVYPFIRPIMFIGPRLKISNDAPLFWAIELPNKLVIQTQVDIVPGKSSFYVPMSFNIDRTENSCYRILPLNMIFCVSDGLENWEKESFGLGTNVPKKLIAISFDREKGNFIGWGWDETIFYITETNISILAVAFFSLAWYLYQCELDAVRGQMRYSTLSMLSGYAGIIIMGVIIVRQIFAFDLNHRIQYVTNIEMGIYNLLMCIMLPFLIGIYVYTTRHYNTGYELRKFAYDTLISMALASIFLGRTTICEETSLCLMVACLWTPFQVMAIFRCTGKSRWIILALFSFFYPFVTIVLVQPILATVPELIEQTWAVSQVLLLLPPTMIGVVASSSPTWLVIS